MLAPTITRSYRFYATYTDTARDIRARLMNEIKAAMKSKDTLKSTTLRSILSEVYAADKSSKVQVPSTTIVNIMRKAVVRRQDTAANFTQASRPDLADRELKESEMLSTFLPPLLSEAEIDLTLSQVIEALPARPHPKKSLHQIIKEFYSRVDKSTVDMALVKLRAEALLERDV